MKTYLYMQADCNDEIEYAFEIECRSMDIEYVAGQIGEDFFHNHDGWECRWPKEFKVYNSDKEFLGIYEVELESTPSFYGTKVEPK